jgi:hypothetical protein
LTGISQPENIFARLRALDGVVEVRTERTWGRAMGWGTKLTALDHTTSRGPMAATVNLNKRGSLTTTAGGNGDGSRCRREIGRSGLSGKGKALRNGTAKDCWGEMEMATAWEGEATRHWCFHPHSENRRANGPVWFLKMTQQNTAIYSWGRKGNRISAPGEIRGLEERPASRNGPLSRTN